MIVIPSNPLLSKQIITPKFKPFVIPQRYTSVGPAQEAEYIGTPCIYSMTSDSCLKILPCLILEKEDLLTESLHDLK
jgi:hypothetical protein